MPRYDDGIPELTPQEWEQQESERAANDKEEIAAEDAVQNPPKPKPCKWKPRKVKDLHTDIVYDDRKQAAEATGVSESAISKSVWFAEKGSRRRFIYADTEPAAAVPRRRGIGKLKGNVLAAFTRPPNDPGVSSESHGGP